MILRLGHTPVNMETFGARPTRSLDECRKLAEAADAMIVVVAHRYGWVPALEEGGDGQKSITWHEVDAAMGAARRVLAYLSDGSDLSLGQSDDDPRLEEFRAYLRRTRIVSSFSGPTDLALQIATDLTRELEASAYDFATVLGQVQLPQGASARTESPLAMLPRPALIRALLEQDTPSLAVLDPLIQGAHLQAAQSALAAHLQRCHQLVSGLQTRRSTARREANEFREQLRKLEQEPRPSAPLAPVQWPYPASLDASPGEQRETLRLMELNSAAREQHRREMEQFKTKVVAYEARQQTIPVHRQQLMAAEQYVAQLEANLAQQTSDCTMEQRLFEQQVGIARDRDIAALLGEMRESSGRQVGEPQTALQGFLALLATDRVASALSQILSGDPLSADRVDEVRDQVAELLELTVRGSYLTLGERGLLLAQPLLQGLERGAEMAKQMERALDQLPLDALRLFGERASGIARFELAPISDYRKLLDPKAIAAASAAVQQLRPAALTAQSTAAALLEESVPLRTQVREVETRAHDRFAELEANAAGLRAYLGEYRLFWQLISHTGPNHRREANTLAFCTALRSEAEQRIGKTLGRFFADCLDEDFGVKKAKRLLFDHAGLLFGSQREALERRTESIAAHIATLNQALTDLKDQPEKMAKSFQERLSTALAFNVFPILTVFAAGTANGLIREHAVVFSSDHPAYQPLPAWTRTRLRGAVAVSAFGAAAAGIGIVFPLEYALVVGGMGLTYLVSMFLWLSALQVMSRSRAARAPSLGRVGHRGASRRR